MPSRESINRALYGSPSMLYDRPRSTIGTITSTFGRPLVAAANLPYTPYMPLQNNDEDFGLDLSLYNWGYQMSMEPDWIALAAFNQPKIKFIYIRLGISWGYIDPTFKRTWEALKQYTDIYRMAYHVIYVSQQVEPQLDNIEKAFDSVGGDMGEGPVIEDWELTNNQPKNVVSYRCGEMLEKGPQRFGIRFDCYTGEWFMIGYAEPQEWWKENYFLMAHYLNPTYGEHPGPPSIPATMPRKHVAVHQSGSYFDGRPMGVPGNVRVDGNRFELGNLMTLEEYLGVEAQPPEPSPGIDYNELLRAEADKLRASADQLDFIADSGS